MRTAIAEHDAARRGLSLSASSVVVIERRIISQRTKDGLAHKMADGVKVGRLSQLPLRPIERITQERMAARSLGAIARG